MSLYRRNRKERRAEKRAERKRGAGYTKKSNRKIID